MVGQLVMVVVTVIVITLCLLHLGIRLSTNQKLNIFYISYKSQIMNFENLKTYRLQHWYWQKSTES